MKYISFAIPCYNSQEYMAHAIETILTGGEDVEIIIVNDGSKDNTSKIGHEYAEKYPDIIRFHMYVRCIIWMRISTDIILDEKISRSMKRL